MYLEYFGLTEKPFAIEPNPRYIVLGEDHREALATLVYAIEEQEGWAAIIGEPGLGKTTLIIALLQELSDKVIPAVISNPRLEPLDFMNMVALELGLQGPFQTKGAFLAAMKQFILRCRKDNKILLLAVDEAQTITQEMLLELRLLGNLDDGSPRVLNIFFAAQPELMPLLKTHEATALRQRLRHFYSLRPMTRSETGAYIKHRIKVAGGKEALFTERAIDLVRDSSGGVPRLVNLIADETMLVAYTKGRQQVEYDLVADAIRNHPLLDWTPELNRKYPQRVVSVGARQPVEAAPAAVAAPLAGKEPVEATPGEPQPVADVAASEPPEAWPKREEAERPDAADLYMEEAPSDPVPGKAKKTGSWWKKLLAAAVVLFVVAGGMLLYNRYTGGVFFANLKALTGMDGVQLDPQAEPPEPRTSFSRGKVRDTVDKVAYEDWGPTITKPVQED